MGPLVECWAQPETSLPAAPEGLKEAQQTWRLLPGFGKAEIFPAPLRSAKPKMCLARKPSLIFKPLHIFYINLIHMFLISLD